jgi:ATP-binding cassette subfamily C protein CydD
MSVLRVSFLSGFALEFLASISVAIVAVTIGLRLLGGELTLGIGLFVLLLAPEAFLPLRQVGAQFHAAAEGMAATEPVFAVLDDAWALAGSSEAPDTEPDPTHIPATTLTTHALRVTRGAHVLPAVDLTVVPGEITLLRGPSGVGKSSVIAALLGFADHDGEIRLGDASVVHARHAIAWAGQQPGLVTGTIAANVALGDPDPDAGLVSSCLRDAHLDQDVDAQQLLGVRGDGLSGGQAQRVAIARALYRLRSGRASILILDEPTSALDATTEAAIWRTLHTQAAAGTAILLVSHRASAASIAARTVTLLPEAVAA